MSKEIARRDFLKAAAAGAAGIAAAGVLGGVSAFLHSLSLVRRRGVSFDAGRGELAGRGRAEQMFLPANRKWAGETMSNYVKRARKK